MAGTLKLLALGWLAGLTIQAAGWTAVAQAAGRSKASGVAQVRRLLETHCLECHGGKAIRSSFDLSTRDGLLRGGESGQPAVVPGNAQASLLYRKLTHADEPGMPYQR